jgi:hypothetical protein
MIRPHWQGWRRDLVVALIGCAITAVVLVPIGWSRVAAERRRAEAAEQKASGLEEKANQLEARERLARELIEAAMQAELDAMRARGDAVRPAPYQSEKD